MVQSHKFVTGAPVRVLPRNATGHVRTPWYLRGKQGCVERLCGCFPNPEELAYRRPGLPAVPLYRVRFRMGELWPDAEARDDTLDADIFEHWLEPALDVERS